MSNRAGFQPILGIPLCGGALRRRARRRDPAPLVTARAEVACVPSGTDGKIGLSGIVANLYGATRALITYLFVSDSHSLQKLTAGEFREDLGNLFRLSAGSPGNGIAPFELELIEVTEHASGAPAPFRAPFSLLLHGPLTPVLPQAIYRLEHERLGALELFIVPVGPDEPATPGGAPAAMRYEVVFA